MSRKLKFKPVITRVKLDPEQAVLSCTCYTSRWVVSGVLSEHTYDPPVGYFCTASGKSWVLSRVCAFGGSGNDGKATPVYGNMSSSSS